MSHLVDSSMNLNNNQEEKTTDESEGGECYETPCGTTVGRKPGSRIDFAKELVQQEAKEGSRRGSTGSESSVPSSMDISGLMMEESGSLNTVVIDLHCIVRLENQQNGGGTGLRWGRRRERPGKEKEGYGGAPHESGEDHDQTGWTGQVGTSRD